MKIAQAFILLAAIALSGCTTPAQTRAAAMQKAQEQCASQGKQFVVNKVEESKGKGALADTMVTVSGQCVGPGDPGYVPPK